MDKVQKYNSFNKLIIVLQMVSVVSTGRSLARSKELMQ
jgi:hypothetical protein